jgi:hypothetical protein
MMKQLWLDECAFIISAELVLVASIVIIGVIVGLAEIQSGVVQELNDLGDAFGSVNQSFMYGGFSAEKDFSEGFKSITVGSSFIDLTDDCDNNQCDLSCGAPVPEEPKI